jgi:dTDP-4-amino-4,6-dideoxygalactose transaminase
VSSTLPLTVKYSSPSPSTPSTFIPCEGINRRLDSLRHEIHQIVSDVIDSGKYLNSNRVIALEQEFQRHWQRASVAVNSGTTALSLSLCAADIKPGDEVIVPALTFVSTAFVVNEMGAVPVFVDVDPSTLTIDPSAVQAAITPRTTAIIPVHLYGNPCDMNQLMAIARRHQLKVVEDCAQAHGATLDGKPVGTFGDYGAFSLYCGKNIGGMEDGGLVTVADESQIPTLHRLRDLGRIPGERYTHTTLGMRGRMGELNAGIIALQLKRLNAWNKRRQEIARFYRESLSKHLQLIPVKTGYDPVYYKFTGLCSSVPERQQLEKFLIQSGIQSERIYPQPISSQPVYLNGLAHRIEDIRNTASLCGRLICLPMYPELLQPEIERVVKAVEDFYRTR